jgi:chemotaxis protein CheD
MKRSSVGALNEFEKPHRKVHIVQGEFFVTDDPSVVVATLLSSCVAACVRDPVAGVGGMNHFLLPGTRDGASGESERMVFI